MSTNDNNIIKRSHQQEIIDLVSCSSDELNESNDSVNDLNKEKRKRWQIIEIDTTCTEFSNTGTNNDSKSNGNFKNLESESAQVKVQVGDSKDDNVTVNHEHDKHKKYDKREKKRQKLEDPIVSNDSNGRASITSSSTTKRSQKFTNSSSSKANIYNCSNTGINTCTYGPTGQRKYQLSIDICRNDGDDGIVTMLLPLRVGVSSMNESLVHIQQKDAWSCGYRNLQMLLSAILPNVSIHHPIHGVILQHTSISTSTLSIHNTTGTQTQSSSSSSYTHHNHDYNYNYNSSTTTTIITLPSIKQLQNIIEESWKQQFDTQGRQHFHNQIYGKRGHNAKIGAVEISSILSYLYVDTTVLQFIACHASRSLLGLFVWSYFHKLPFGYHESCYYCKENDICSSLDSSFEIIQYISPLSLSQHNYRTCDTCSDDKNDGCGHPLLPLYLQWEGHSVTCIGIEKIPKSHTAGSSSSTTDTSCMDEFEFNLLIYDPMKSGATIKKCVQQPLQQQTIGKDALRLPTKDLIHKDCQIVLCSLKPLDCNIRQTRAAVSHSNVITAAHDHVERILQQQQKKMTRK